MEHLDTGHGGLLDGADTNDLNLRVDLQGTALCTTGHNGAATGNGEDVLNGHKEGLVGLTNRIRNVGVNCFHELLNLSNPLGVTFESLQSRHADHGSVITVKLLRGEEVTNLHLDEVEKLFVINHVSLVQCHQQGGHANLASEQHVLTGLRHGTVGSSNHEDCAVHLCSTGNHVLDVVSVTGSVNVCVVTLLSLVLNVSDVNGNTALALLRSAVDHTEVALFVQVRVLVSQNLGDSSGQGGLTVVNVTNGTDVNLAVAIECHREHCTTLGLTTQVANVTEHLGQRYESLDDLDAGCILHGTHVTTTRV